MDWVRNMPEEVTGKNYVIRDRWNKDASIKFETFLPIRPIVFGGDDATFVCEGRLGIALTVKFLQAFHENAKLPDDKPAFACAGVAIVPVNYPFARAYGLAEELAREAKRQARKYDDKKRVSLIHWHISASGLTLDWEDIQRREYQTTSGNLLLRPLVINKADDVQGDETGWRTWDVFIKQVEEFRTSDDWKGRRNKLKELREVLRQGEGATQDFTNAHGLLPDVIAGQEDYRKTGWYDQHCVYFDALDADDWFIYPRDRKEENRNA